MVVVVVVTVVVVDEGVARNSLQSTYLTVSMPLGSEEVFTSRISSSQSLQNTSVPQSTSDRKAPVTVLVSFSRQSSGERSW